jgi:hypothetical protein
MLRPATPPSTISLISPPSRRTYFVEDFWIMTLFHWVEVSRVLGPVDPWRWRHCVPSKSRVPITQWDSVTPQKKRNLNHAAMKTSHNSHSLNFSPKFCRPWPPPSSPSRWAGPKYHLCLNVLRLLCNGKICISGSWQIFWCTHSSI